jgi:hypothetical protein
MVDKSTLARTTLVIAFGMGAFAGVQDGAKRMFDRLQEGATPEDALETCEKEAIDAVNEMIAEAALKGVDIHSVSTLVEEGIKSMKGWKLPSGF